MQNEPQILSTTEGSGLDAETTQVEPHNIWIISDELANKCDFWVTLANSGNLTPHELLGEETLGDLFDKVGNQGIVDSEPVMLTNSSGTTPTFTYLIPLDTVSPTKSFSNHLEDVISSWNPKKLGLYIPNELMPEEGAHKLILEGVHTLIEQSEIKDFYLFTGSRGMVQILDSAHRIRQKFAAENLELIVYH